MFLLPKMCDSFRILMRQTTKWKILMNTKNTMELLVIITSKKKKYYINKALIINNLIEKN